MTVKEGDRVYWRGRRAKVLVVRESGLTLHVGEGQIVRYVSEPDYIVRHGDNPEPAPPSSTTKPSQAKPHIAKARRKVSTGKGK